MSLPGLQLNSIPVEEKTLVIHVLSENTEWRFEVAYGENVQVKLLSGMAELFGTELALKQAYNFTGCKAAIYSWHGCRLEVTGVLQSDYIAEETPMISYVNTHFALENMRQSAMENNELGPRVLIVGPDNAGKTMLVKILAAYSSRTGGQPVVVNTNPREGMLSIPGTLSTIVLDSIVDVEEGWGTSPTNGPSQIPVKLPLVYYYGMEDPEAKSEIFKPMITRLALSVTNRMEDDIDVKHSGCIIDTCGSIGQGKANYDLIHHIVAEFSVNVLIVLGSERLYNDMSRRFTKQTTGPGRTINVLKLDKSGGCVDRDAQYLKQLRQTQTREYFSGDPRNLLSPHTQQIDFTDIFVYKIEDTALLDSLLPGGESEDLSAKISIYEKVQPTTAMQNCILAIVQAEPNDSQENIRDASVIGFVFVAEVDEKKKKLRVLAPLSGRLPRKAMVWGTWPENVGELAG
ncbi:MAG: Cleavage polyadenylation factor subunit clp1 [Icmadophila ericetorum]|nr:Cleavage polyadenylation factor subunit clp1 [Icmadophila ericetorum]